MRVGQDESAIEWGEGGEYELVGGREHQVGPRGLGATVGDSVEACDVRLAILTDEASGEGLFVRLVALGGDGAAEKGREGSVEVEEVHVVNGHQGGVGDWIGTGVSEEGAERRAGHEQGEAVCPSAEEEWDGHGYGIHQADA